MHGVTMKVIFFDVLLTVHLSVLFSVINQLDAQNFCFTINLFHASTWNTLIVKQKFCASSWLWTNDETVNIQSCYKINTLHLLVNRLVSGTGVKPVKFSMLLESSLQVTFYLHDIACKCNLNIVFHQDFSYYLYICLVTRKCVISRTQNA